jgi:hypothetical protein
MVQDIPTDLDERIRACFDAAESYCDTRKKNVAAQLGLSRSVAAKVFPRARWKELQREWLLVRVRRAADEVFNESNFREDFSRERIVRRLRSLGAKEVGVARFVDAEWRSRRMELATKEEKVRAIVDRLISEGITVNEMNGHRLQEELGTGFSTQVAWVIQMIRKAKGQILSQAGNSGRQSHVGMAVTTTSPSCDCLNTDELDLRDEFRSGKLFRHNLRPDIAEVAWPLLREDALSGQYATSTIVSRFWGYRKAGELLGEQVPDLKKATLSGIQARWAGYKHDGKLSKRGVIKAALINLFSQLVILSEGRPEIDRREMLLIASWLSLTPNPRHADACDVLSADEQDVIIKSCLADVKEGMKFIAEGHELLDLSTRQSNGINATPLVRWGSALMIIIMLLTGLRRQSVINLQVGDWAAIHPGMFALIWRHGKKREERVAVLPATLAGLLDDYAEANRELREAFNTERVFILGSQDGYWQAELLPQTTAHHFGHFVKRHAVTRAGKPLKLTSQLTRRTFVTRELYEGQSVWALQLQLGHMRLESTLRYGKLDMYEHPARVGAALDSHGRCALTFWRGPIVLMALDAPERERLLELRSERDQGLGLCRYRSCKKINEGILPPCSLCEHLITGREFFGTWDAEQARREQGLVKLEGLPRQETLLSHHRQQYALFMANYDRLKAESS